MTTFQLNLTKEQIQRLYDLVDTSGVYNDEEELLQDILNDKLVEIDELETENEDF